MTSTDLVAVEPLLPMDPTLAKAAMVKFQALTAAMLVADDWQKIAGGKDFVKRSGVQKIATGYALSCDVLEEEVIERNERGEPIRARAKVRVTHPAGRHWDGTGRCSTTERGFSKAEHDVTATAVTRATNRAVLNLVGFGQVSAEEVDPAGAGPQAAGPTLPWGPIQEDDKALTAAVEVVQQIAPEIDAAKFIMDMGQFFDGVPEANLKMLRALLKTIGQARTPMDDEPVAEAEVVA
jgi:hypothetical protein